MVSANGYSVPARSPQLTVLGGIAEQLSAVVDTAGDGRKT